MITEERAWADMVLELLVQVARLRTEIDVTRHVNETMDAEIKRLSAENARLIKEIAELELRIAGLEK